MNSALPANTGEPNPTEWSSQIAEKPAIHPRDSNIHLLRYAMPALQIRRPDGRCQPVFRVVRHCHRFIVNVERSNVTDWSEDFFFYTARRFGQSSIDRRLDVKTFVQLVAEFGDTPARYDHSSFFARQFVV